MVDGVGIATSRDPSGVQQSYTVILLFALVEKNFPVPSQLQEQIASKRVCCADETVSRENLTLPRGFLENRRPPVHVDKWDGYCSDAGVIKFQKCRFDHGR